MLTQMAKKFNVYTLILLAGLVTACGGSSGGGSDNAAPVANAGSDATVDAGTVVTLDGSGSSDSDGSIASYSWAQIMTGTGVALDDATLAGPSFTAPDNNGDLPFA